MRSKRLYFSCRYIAKNLKSMFILQLTCTKTFANTKLSHKAIWAIYWLQNKPEKKRHMLKWISRIISLYLFLIGDLEWLDPASKIQGQRNQTIELIMWPVTFFSLAWLPLSWELGFSSWNKRPLVSLSSGEYLPRGECLLSGLNLNSWSLESRLPTSEYGGCFIKRNIMPSKNKTWMEQQR